MAARMTRDPRIATGDQAKAARTYRRSAWTRIVGAGCALLFVGAAASFAASRGSGRGLALLVGLAILSLCNLVTAWADRVTLSDAGIECRNSLLGRFGRRDRRVAWEDVVQVREHRRPGRAAVDGPPSAIVLTLRSGRRLVLDSLEHSEEILDSVRRHSGRNRFTGGAS